MTHKVTDAAKVAERFIYIRDGNIVFDGDAVALKNTEDQELRRFINELFVAERCS